MKAVTRLLAVLAFVGWTGSVVALPITDTVTVDGTTWAQVNLFSSLSWNEIDQACPSGICTASTLNGFDMEGWRWASLSDIQNLFAYYIGAPIEYIAGFGNGLDVHDSSWAPAFYDDGWVATAFFMEGQRYTRGMLSTEVNSSRFYNARMIDYDEAVIFATQGTFRADSASLPQSYGKDIAFKDYGAWFYQVPSPSTFALIGMGLAGLGWMRRKLV